MSNPKHDPRPFTKNHLSSATLEAGGNKGKQMQNKSNEHPDYVPAKGK
ncbi:acid-soluble spore protein N [Bacillus taeanensis]|jgi:small acid-soluble spore protein N (minor)|uniref:Acid-soluble spore protein N n=1 Tax=Bacillus taeanensis TaxID=273032 RepID=A0A366Y4G8_9BACI|nr:acid-soluble spore protein N [Bacillus taeanensis]RBW71091.1 acid-soluble spore protein N [Bacillus taeanensis]